jgi:hypothetical protein
MAAKCRQPFEVVLLVGMGRPCLAMAPTVGSADACDRRHGLAGREPQCGQRMFVGGPGVEGLDVEADVFAGVTAAHHLSGAFAGVGEHDASERQPGIALG